MRRWPCSKEYAAILLQPVLGAKANPHGLNMDEATDGNCYVMLDDSKRVVGSYVLRGQGTEVWVQAAAGVKGGQLANMMDDLIHLHGAGFHSIAFKTHRRGLMKKAQDRGLSNVSDTDGYIMRKIL